MSADNLGEPLTSVYSIPGGEARLFERGLTIKDAGGEIVISFAFPMIGRPSIVTGDPSTTLVFEPDAIHFDLGSWDLNQLTQMIQSALTGRVGLVPTSQTGVETTLSLGPVTALSPHAFGIPVTAPTLQERQLYDVALLADGDQWRVVAPHAVYHRQTWTDFGIAHVTDVHVARRIDRFRELLTQAGRHLGAQRLYNFNNRFRGFIRYANYLHGLGLLDIILSTGDQYDYIYEEDDDQAGGGNAAFLRQLILGQAPGPDFPEVEELRVPIFMIPGNHDYRKHPYRLIFDLHIGGDIVGANVSQFTNYSGYNISRADAEVLERRLSNFPDLPIGNGVIDVSEDEAARMVAFDKEVKAHKAFLEDRLSYIVRLGNHRIVMLDSGHDVGVVDDISGWLKSKLGFGSEDEATFLGGSPNSEGVSAAELDLVSAALAEAPGDGLVIVGIHAPLVNPVNEEYPYFLRQSQRPAHPDQVHGFLARYDPLHSQNEDALKNQHPTWFPDERDHRDPTFVKRVDRNDMLDYDIARGKADELIQRLAGVGAPRPADLVLSGHTHYYNEFSVRTMHNGELAFYMDFYTQNPVNYYPTRFTLGWKEASLPGAGRIEVPQTDKTYIEVLPGAAADADPEPLEDATLKYDLKVPPYPNPLDTAPNPSAWWAEHRPLLLQTGALGPRKTPSFLSGFKVLQVKNSVIDKIHFVSVERLEVNNYRLPWDEAILPDVPGPPHAAWLSVSEGSTIPGGHITAAKTGDNQIMLVLTDPNGGIYCVAGNYGEGWGPWRNVSEGSSTPGAPISAVVSGDQVTIFLADPAGLIYANAGSYEDGWDMWRSVSEGGSVPGSHVTAVKTGERITLFVADRSGGIYTNAGTYEGGWGPWRNVSEGSSTPGAPVSAVVMGDRITLFATDPAGGIYSISGSYDSGWGGWASVSEGSTILGGHITAVTTGDNQITLFVADSSGGVYTVVGNYEYGWGPWASVSEGSSTPGAPISAIVTGDRVDLFIADLNGGIYTASGNSITGYGGWSNVSEGVSIPGGNVTAVLTENQITLFVADLNGGIYARGKKLPNS